MYIVLHIVHILNLESQNQAKNFPVGLQGFMSYDRPNRQTDRQTNRDYNFIYI